MGGSRGKGAVGPAFARSSGTDSMCPVGAPGRPTGRLARILVIPRGGFPPVLPKESPMSFSRIRPRMAVALAAAFTLGFAPALLAQAPASAPAKADTASGPKLVIPEDKKDVGTVPKGEPIKHTFVLKNTGKADLHITDVTKNFSGPIWKTALLLTDDPSTPQTTLFLSAVVKPFVEALPYGFFRITALSGEAASPQGV